MGFLPVFLGGLACYMNRGVTGSRVLFWIALAGAAGAFWSYGIMHNHATNAARRRSDYRGGFFDFTQAEAESASDGITRVNMAFSFVCFVSIAVSIYHRVMA